MTQEFVVTVRSDSVRQTMQADDLPEEQLGNMTCNRGLPSWNKMCHLRKSVDYYKDKVRTSLGLREAHNKVHGQIFPRAIRNWKRSGETSILHLALCSLTGVAAPHKKLHIEFQLKPVIICFYQCNTLVAPHVVTEPTAMCLPERCFPIEILEECITALL